MSRQQYDGQRSVDPEAPLNLDNLKDKSVVITGGASGFGKAFAQEFIKAGAYVTFGDINEEQGAQVAAELGRNAQFVKCDVTSWEDQLAMFKAAVSHSPRHSCDIVLANAGIGNHDQVLYFDETTDEPVKPDLSTLNVTLIGTFYTANLAMQYFKRQPETEEHDRCLIMTSSLAGYLDLTGAPQYCASKFGVRALMRVLRRSTHETGIRVNNIAPWFVQTSIISAPLRKLIDESGVEWAQVPDTVSAVLRIASDREVNGRALAIVPRSITAKGYLDLKADDCDDSEMLKDLQRQALFSDHLNAPQSVAQRN